MTKPHTSTYIEQLFEAYKENPSSVTKEWQQYFAVLQVEPVHTNTSPPVLVGGETPGAASTAQNNVSRLIQSYRYHGHRYAKINPLGQTERDKTARQLSLAEFDLSQNQLNDIFATAGVLAQSHAQLKDIIEALKKTYCHTLAIQLGGIASLDERRWLREKLEATQGVATYKKEEKHRIWQGLMVAASFEKFLHTKYVGVKRFSIEGGDAVIPMLDMLIEQAGNSGMTDIVFGMAHRGRLNVLVNIMHKPFEQIFSGFNDNLKSSDEAASGDVKYHMGKSYDAITSQGQKIHLSLLNNPSHLEAVNPVIVGSTRAKQERAGKDGIDKVLALQIHGDAAFCGQGIVPETLNLAGLKAFNVGGSIHLVINNQVGFTANPEDTFSGEYCTDIARMLQIPIFHVNGDDPEACVTAMQLAFEYRQKFHKDVVIDLVCYRKYGHNEGDDPSFTQPTMYAKIKTHKTPAYLYKEKLLAAEEMDTSEAENMESDYQERLQIAFDKAKEGAIIEPDIFKAEWSGFSKNAEQEPNTATSQQTLGEIAQAITTYPKEFTPNKKVAKIIEQRADMLKGKMPMNWGAAEAAAYGALLKDGYSMRLVGQDVQRGTFSHRHVGMVDALTDAKAFPLSKMAANGANLQVWNSSLSELAVLGFEYGYSLASPKTLDIWEAQFGDFSNGAQILIDQFIVSSEVKWHRMTGLVMSLPHGYEGQGPEHSSARLERYLQLCGDDNMTVANPTTPAQIFHLLRRQMLRKMRKPLVYMSPKSLFRHPQATSEVAALTKGAFQKIIPDPYTKKAKRIILCCGKVYYDLLARQQENKRNDVALIRVEQLYPLPLKDIQKELKKYKTKDVVWLQEESRNQGAWTYILDNLGSHINMHLRYIGRKASASPAVGSPQRHAAEQKAIVDEAFVQ